MRSKKVVFPTPTVEEDPYELEVVEPIEQQTEFESVNDFLRYYYGANFIEIGNRNHPVLSVSLRTLRAWFSKDGTDTDMRLVVTKNGKDYTIYV